MWSVKHFCHYLYGYQCVAYTDHEPLKSLLNTPHPSGKLVRWGLALQEVDLVLQYRPGKTNVAADSLSCFPIVQSSVHAICLEESLPITGGDDSQEGEDGMIDQLKGAAANHLTFQSDLVEVESCGDVPRGSLVLL